MAGTLYLVPNALGPGDLLAVLPAPVATTAARLDYFIGEDAKSTRAFLKRVGETTPLTHAIRDIEIAELDVSTPAAALPALLAPILAGRDGGLVSEAGCPAVADPGARVVAIRDAEKRSLQREQTQIFIETPYRNRALFGALIAACRPGTDLCVACDLTLATQAIATRTIDEWRRMPPETDKRPAIFLLLAR